MRVIGYDGAGEAIKRRKRSGHEPERDRSESGRDIKTTIKRGFVRAQIDSENLSIERTLGVRVR